MSDLSSITILAREALGLDFGESTVISDGLVVYVDGTKETDERKARGAAEKAGGALAEPVDGPEDIPINGFDPYAKVYWFRRKGD